MPDQIINCKRSFQIWSYAVSHRELLLRSTKSEEYPTRIGVFFKGVEEFHLPTSFSGLLITERSFEEFSTFRGYKPSSETGYDWKAFQVQGDDFVGYVVALIALSHEDTGEYYEPSFFSSGTRLGM
jgi:hypothetical protein